MKKFIIFALGILIISAATGMMLPWIISNDILPLPLSLLALFAFVISMVWIIRKLLDILLTVESKHKRRKK